MTEIWFDKMLLYKKIIWIEFQLAAESQGVVVSNDNYRDLANENMEYKKVVEERLLMYSFVADRFMPPDDPLGRSGPTLDNFLRMQPKYVVNNVEILVRFWFLLPFLIAMWLFFLFSFTEKVIRSHSVRMAKNVRTEINANFIIRNVEWDHINQ